MDGALSRNNTRRSQYALVLVMNPMNGTFDKKNLFLPFKPEVLKLGRQTSPKLVAASNNGLFDSRVLSRQHAEIWADRDTGNVWIKDCKSSNGTYVNRRRLSGENTESDPFPLKQGDILELGVDISTEESSTLVYRKISARIEKISFVSLTAKQIEQQRTQPKPASLPSITTRAAQKTETSLQNAVFGTALETLVMPYLSSTSNTTGLAMKEEMRSQLNFELAAKILVSQIRAVYVDTARIQSVRTMLEAMRAGSGASRDEETIEKLKEENDLLRAEIMQLRDAPSQAVVPTAVTPLAGPQRQHTRQTSENQMLRQLRRPRREKVLRPSEINNLVLLVVTTLLMTTTGVFIMYFFNPPVWQAEWLADATGWTSPKLAF